MLEGRKVTNALLLVIAVCLVLVVLDIYGVQFVTEAEAAAQLTDNYEEGAPVPVHLYAKTPRGEWIPVEANKNGHIFVHDTYP